MIHIAVWILLTLLVSLVLAWQAWVGVQLWGWFLEPYTGWPAPSVQVLMGLLLMYRFWVMPTKRYEKPNLESMKYLGMTTLGGPLFALTLGYLIKAIF